MKLFTSLRNTSTVRNAVKSLAGIVQGIESLDSAELSVVTLLGAVINAGGDPGDWELDGIKDVLPPDIPPRKAATILEQLKGREEWNTSDAIAELTVLPDDRKRELMSSLLRIALYKGQYIKAQKELVEKIAVELGLHPSVMEALEHQEVSAMESRERAMRSWTGIIVALIIITIFILTATFLKSVLFGFVLAFLALPLECFFERRLRHPGFLLKPLSSAGILLAPLARISERIRKRFGHPGILTQQQKENAAIARRVNQAVTLTVISIFIAMSVAILIISSLSFNYVANMGRDVKHWADCQVEKQRSLSGAANASTSVEESYFSSFISSIIRKLEEGRDSIEKWPLVQHGVEELSKVLKDENNQREMFSALIKKSCGVFSFTAGFMTNFATIVFDMIMTLFFFLLFLQKLALYSARNTSNNRISSYIVKSIFHSKWMPHTSDETRNQARKILDDIGLMLKTWLKGYISIIAIESTLYISAFLVLGVPYAPILGFLAGCTVILPYVGPISSASLTLLVCLAMGGSHTNIIMLMGIVATYILITGIIDQFFIYPALVGESLGLNKLETIVMVLLGCLFAGLPGMIFAVPTASIIKYIIPQIYRCWEPQHDTPTN